MRLTSSGGRACRFYEQLSQPNGIVFVTIESGFRIAAPVDDRKHDDTSAAIINAVVDPILFTIQNPAIERKPRGIIYRVVFLPQFRKQPHKIKVDEIHRVVNIDGTHLSGEAVGS